eukprot:5138524-Amphidinium_carterae.1
MELLIRVNVACLLMLGISMLYHDGKIVKGLPCDLIQRPTSFQMTLPPAPDTVVLGIVLLSKVVLYDPHARCTSAIKPVSEDQQGYKKKAHAKRRTKTLGIGHGDCNECTEFKYICPWLAVSRDTEIVVHILCLGIGALGITLLNDRKFWGME